MDSMNKRTKKTFIRSFLILITMLSMLLGSFGCISGNPYDMRGSYYTTIEEAFDEYQSLSSKWEMLYWIDTELNPTPIILGYKDCKYPDDVVDGGQRSLLVFPIDTTEQKGRTYYRISSSFELFRIQFKGDTKVGEVVEETYVNIDEDFPGIWFGVVYPDKRDKIRVNGRVPELYDVEYAGSEYVFWYIAQDDEEPIVSFEE